MVDGRSSSVKSGKYGIYAPEILPGSDDNGMRPTFLDTNLGCAGLRLLLGSCLLGLLHAPYLWLD